jgi:hypothetical protein
MKTSITITVDNRADAFVHSAPCEICDEHGTVKMTGEIGFCADGAVRFKSNPPTHTDKE